MGARTIEVQPAARIIGVDDGLLLRAVEVPGRVIEFVELGRLVLNILASSGVFNETAGVPLSALRAVRLEAGLVQYLDSATLSHAQSCIGITVTAAAAAAPVAVRATGFLDAVGFVEGLAVYVGLNGQLTQVSPVVGFLLKVGHAVSSTRMFVQIERSIRL